MSVTGNPYDDERAHLVPLLEAFQAAGNYPVGGWFDPKPSGCGWDVYMRRPLDPVLIESHLAVDAMRDRIRVDGDRLECSHCGTSVHGANAGD